MLFSQIHYFRFHNVFRRISWHHYFLPDAGGGRMEHKRFPKERVQLGKAIPGCRIWGAQLGFSGFKELLVSADFLICNLIAFDQGSTMVTSNYIRLTPDQRSKQGALWNKLPCKVSLTPDLEELTKSIGEKLGGSVAV